MKIKNNDCKLLRIMKSNVTKAVLLNLFFFLACVLLFNMVYETNDEFTVSAIASGAYGTSAPFLLFSNVIFGSIVTFLHTLFQPVNWYMVLQMVLCFVSFCVICTIFYKKFGTLIGTAVNFALLMAAAVDHYVFLQFSKNSILILLAGFLWLFYALHEKKGWWQIAGAIILASFGMMLRYKNVLVVACFAFGLCLIDLFIKQRFQFKVAYFKKNLRYIVSFVLLFGTMAGLLTVDSLAYKDNAEWQEYYDYNEVRSVLLDYGLPSYEKHIEEYNKLGISATDYNMLKNWSFNDPEKFDIETLEKILEIPNEAKQWNPVVLFAKAVNEAASKAVMLRVGLLFSIPLVLILLLCKKKHWLYPGYCVFAIFALYLYLMAIRRVVYRAEYGIWLCAAVFLIYSFDTGVLQKIKLKKGTMRRLLACFILMTTFLSYNFLHDTYMKTKDPIDENTTKFFERVEKDNKHTYLLDVYTFNDIEKGYPPLSARPVDAFRNVSFLGGWSTNMPLNLAIMEKNGVSNPYRDAVDNDSVYFVDNKLIDQKVRYIRQNYCPTAKSIFVGRFNGYSVYKIVS